MFPLCTSSQKNETMEPCARSRHKKISSTARNFKILIGNVGILSKCLVAKVTVSFVVKQKKHLIDSLKEKVFFHPTF